MKLALPLLVVSFPAASSTQLLAPLKDQDAIYGCSWSASSPEIGPGVVLLAEADDSRTLMNIGGSDVELALVDEQGSLARAGDILERTFKAEGIVVKARYRVTWTCPEDDESCEVTRFDVSFDVTSGGRRQTAKATGDFGC
ncbi:MAG: hypothetical protein J7507_12475 [Pseudoxanthomonas sp.]|nr:hypothetical protein [Pseudoxanthomonas sp.]